MTISTDKVDADVLKKPGQWDFPHLLQVMLGFGLVSSLFDALTFAALLLVFHADATLFQTAWFLESLLTELVIVGVMRTQKRFYSSAVSPLLLWTSVTVGIVALALPYLPITAATGFRPLPPTLVLALLAIIICYVIASEALKTWIGAFQSRRTSKLRGRSAT